MMMSTIAHANPDEPEKVNVTMVGVDFSSRNTNGLRKPDVVEHQRKKTPSSSKHPMPFKAAFRDFTDSTTLHGLRFIFMDDAFFVRRLIWLVLVLASAVLLSVQIVERIVFFRSYPMNVNVQVNYNNTLVFPAITICNQNTFRATAATQQNLYRLIECMYDSRCVMNRETLLKYKAAKFTLEDIYTATTHGKRDLIEGCKWQNEACGPENFTEILTDHGVCYSFNIDVRDPLWVTATGSDYGLKLTLNVEQYEYMPGPHSAAGIKILLHDQKEFPKVAELGLAIPTGSHTFIGIQLLRIENLPEPHGACHSKASPYYKQYTPDACQMACTTQLLMQLCKCRHFYMPHINGTPPVCTLEQYYDCYVNKIAYVKARVRKECECPVPCDFLLYDPTISFATTSVYATDSLLATTSTGELKEKYHQALDTTSRMDRLKFTDFKTLGDDMGKKFVQFTEAILGVLQKMHAQKVALGDIYQRMQTVFKDKDYLLKWQEFHVRKNFIRPKNAMEERTLFPLALGFQEFSYLVDTKILKAGNDSFPDDVRTAIFLDVKDILEGKMDLATRAHQNYTQLIEAYANGAPIFRYRFETERNFNDSLLITPRPLLNDSLYHSSLALRLCYRTGEDILHFRNALSNYLEAAKDSYAVNGSDPRRVHHLNVQFLYYGRRFYHSRSVLYDECIEYPQRFLAGRIDDLSARWMMFQSDYNSLYNTVNHLINEINKMNTTTLKQMENVVSYIHNFTNNGTALKMEIAKEMLSDQISESIADLKTIVSKIRARSQSVYDDWSSLIKSANRIWELVLDDENIEEFYTEKGQFEYLQPYKDVASEVTSNFTHIRNTSDFRHILGNRDSLFLISTEAMIAHLRMYYDRSNLDAEFIKNNFLQLDIFYREKSYEEITQQKAYDMFALLCDIGGSMGLFVGASALTICEILDFGLHQLFFRLFFRIRSNI